MDLDGKVAATRKASERQALQGIQQAMVQLKTMGIHLNEGFDGRITVAMGTLDAAIDRYVIETESEMAKQGE